MENPYYVNIALFIIITTLIKIFFNGASNKHSPNLKGKVIVITGANSGIGLESALELTLLRPKFIVMACRDEHRGLTARQMVNNQGSGS